MKESFFLTLDFVAQFTGGRGGIDHVVNYAIGAILFSILLFISIVHRYHNCEERDRLLVWGFGIGLGRELFMVIMSYIQALGLVSPEALHVVFPPLEHALSNIATVFIAAAFLQYLLNDMRRPKIYLKIGLGLVLFCYFATFLWWGQYIIENPTSKFGQTWCDWLFRINASIWMLIPTIWLLRKTKGWVRNTVCVAFTLFFLTEFLKLPDMYLGEVYENIFTPFRHGFYILAIPLFGYVYIREVYERHQSAEEEKNNLEIQLRQSQKMQAIGTLAGGIAHDFNNILTIIHGYTDLAFLDIPDENPAKESLANVKKAASRARDLVSQILSFSRKENQEMHLPVHPHLIVEETIKLLRASIPSSVRIEKSIDKHCGTVIADPTQIHQIVMNLATNAVHAMKEKGILTLNLQQVTLKQNDVGHREDMTLGPYVMISVSDTGIGMNQQTIDRIYDPFFTTKQAGEGTGMGLAVVHGIVIANHGMIKVNTQEGKGSEFQIYLPAGDMETVELSSKASFSIIHGDEKILWIDDESEVAEMGKRILERQGYKVTAITDSHNALDLFRSHPGDYDLIVTDQTMPGLTGLELAKEMVAIRADIPIILCTGFSAKISDEMLDNAGIKKLYEKPLERMQICSAVREILDRKSE